MVVGQVPIRLAGFERRTKENLQRLPSWRLRKRNVSSKYNATTVLEVEITPLLHLQAGHPHPTRGICGGSRERGGDRMAAAGRQSAHVYQR